MTEVVMVVVYSDKNIMSSPLVTIDARLPVEAAADVMIQNKVRHLLVVEINNNDINKPLGIVTPTDFVAYLKENLNVNEANARILESLRGQGEGEEEQKVVKELEQEGKLKRIHKKVNKNMKMKNQDRARKPRRFLNKMK